MGKGSEKYFSMKKYFWYDYLGYDETMNYCLFKPMRDLNRPLPLIVWLHGSGEVRVSKREFLNEGLPYVLNHWTLKPFGAYILCPQLMIEEDIWAKDENVDILMSLIAKVVSENNIDRNRIILCGHSLGAMGSMYVAERVHNYFSCLCLLSGYEIGVDLSKIGLSTLGVVGVQENDEDPESVEFMWDGFIERFGKESLWEIPCSHADIPKRAFLDDADLDGRSDIIGWMLKNRKD